MNRPGRSKKLCFARAFSLSLCALVITYASGAASQEIKSDPFTILGHLDRYLEFPKNRKQLDKCFRDDNRSCLSLYSNQRAAVAEVFVGGRSEALRRIFAATIDRCGTQAFTGIPSEPSKNSCRGVTTLFYFFKENEEDKAIVSFLQSLKPKVLWNIFVESKAYNGDWVGNRPEVNRWLNLITTFAILDEDPAGRTGYQNVFVHPPPAHTGVAILDPRFKLTGAENDRLEELRKQ